jgi:hypothetical protein
MSFPETQELVWHHGKTNKNNNESVQKAGKAYFYSPLSLLP